MSAATHQLGLPSGWTQAVRRYAAEPRAESFLLEASRFLSPGSPERVPPGRGAETLANLLHAYLQPPEREAVLYELAAISIAQPSPESRSVAPALLLLGGTTALGLLLTRSKR
jgi:hypothetical protein